MTTLKDIAKATGVSVSTVSRALNNRPNISQNTRDLVQRVAREMNYLPNEIKEDNPDVEKKIIVVIVHYIEVPFFSTLVSGIQDAAITNGYSILLFSTERDVISEKRAVSLILERDDVAGVIVAPCETEQIYSQPLHDANIPIVYAAYKPSTALENIWAVIPDDFAGAKMATEYLVSRGVKSIAFFIGPPETKSSNNRINGHLDAIKGTNLVPNIFSGPLTYHAALQKGLEMFNSSETLKFDAIITAADVQAIGIIHALEKVGLKVPDDVSVISSEDTFLTSLSSPQLTSISISIYSMGVKSVSALLKQIKNNSSTGQIELIEPTLKERNSCKKIIYKEGV